MASSLFPSALAHVGRSARLGQATGGLSARLLLEHVTAVASKGRARRLTDGSDAGASRPGGAEVGASLNFNKIVDGTPLPPKRFEGKAVLVVNTASLCG